MMVIEWFLCWLDCIWCWLFWVCRVSKFIWCFVVFCRIDFLCLCDCMIWIVFDEFLYDLVLCTISLLTKSSLCFDKNSMMCIFLFSTMIAVRCSFSVYMNIMDTMKSIFEWFVMYVSICVILIYFDSSYLFKWVILLWRMNNVFEMNRWWSYWNLYVLI